MFSSKVLPSKIPGYNFLVDSCKNAAKKEHIVAIAADPYEITKIIWTKTPKLWAFTMGISTLKMS